MVDKCPFFFQARAGDMIDDVRRGIRWVLHNIHRYGGDPKQSWLVG